MVQLLKVGDTYNVPQKTFIADSLLDALAYADTNFGDLVYSINAKEWYIRASDNSQGVPQWVPYVAMNTTTPSH